MPGSSRRIATSPANRNSKLFAKKGRKIGSVTSGTSRAVDKKKLTGRTSFMRISLQEDQRDKSEQHHVTKPNRKGRRLSRANSVFSIRDSILDTLSRTSLTSSHVLKLKQQSRDEMRDSVLSAHFEEEEKISSDDWIGTDSDSDSDYGSPREDKIEEMRKSFRDSANILRQVQIPDFFEILGGIPSIDDISSDRTEINADLSELERKVSLSVPLSDVGTFVDPLTGQRLTSSSSIISTAVQPKMSTISADRPLESNIDLLEEVNFEEDADLEKEDIQIHFEEDTQKELTHDIDLVEFLNLPLKMKSAEQIFIAVETNDWRQAQTEALDFINRLINKVVNLVESKYPNRLLSDSLSKKKLMDKLVEDLTKLNIEQKTNRFLNHGVVENLRRKGNYRYLTEDAPDQIINLIDQNMDLQNKLSNLLREEEQLKYITYKRVSEIEALIKQEEDIANQSIENLNKIIQKALRLEHFNQLKDFVLHSLKSMSNTRNEISSQRFMYIEKSHTLSTLLERENKLENIGENITIRNYVQLHADTTTLAKKSDGRDQDLTQLNHKCNQYVHIMSHIRDITTALQNKLDIKKCALDDLLQEKSQAREELGYHKGIRRYLRNELAALQLKSGLTSNEALLLDYDETISQVEKVKANIDQLKQKHRQLELRQVTLEKRRSTLTDSVI